MSKPIKSENYVSDLSLNTPTKLADNEIDTNNKKRIL